ncbi:MAG: DegT/DnrJ/EryC1/StrS family aminotransferase [Candidatus Micrarchaeota archaeon]|nr:DegT/DnrJ/EryC1/StrS family aminotransferase [Candidatus Micrarchaeota archaeon]MDE1847566.1 DegT/DnrJ/EryC1/StrS family aminotransferase [Candidatus Micrarchaeota archaeon]MDE1864283.1 DegT/DnrJ/EryC1/StrS family aminotransferase [Candidatus Micrarchaeota archaeon]
MTIPIYEPLLGEEELRNVTEAVKSTWISSKGKFITQFEEEFAKRMGTKYAVATSNGTVSLHLALAALGIGGREEVIVPTLTFIACANTVRYTGAKPVFVDSSKEYWCIDPQKIGKCITKRTRAIMPVHLYGHPCDMDLIMEIAQKHHLFVVEDAAEAHGAKYKGKTVGSFGDISSFSFYGNKILSSGEGGMCITDDETLYQKMRILRDHGMNPSKRYWYDVIGYNYRMTNMQAAIGVAQLHRMDSVIRRKREIARLYEEKLSKLADNGYITLSPQMEWANSVYWMYNILLSGKAKVCKDSLMERLWAKGIETRPIFYPLHTMPPYKQSRRYLVAEKISASGVSLPSGPTLTDEQIEKVCNAIIKEVV